MIKDQTILSIGILVISIAISFCMIYQTVTRSQIKMYSMSELEAAAFNPFMSADPGDRQVFLTKPTRPLEYLGAVVPLILGLAAFVYKGKNKK